MADMDGTVAFLTACHDEEVRQAEAMTELEWPREVWVTPADLRRPNDPEGTLHGSVSVAEYSPKAYARLWEGVKDRIEHGWVVHETGQLVWSETVARSVLLRVDSERELVTSYREKRLELEALLNGTQTYSIDEDARDVIEARLEGEESGLELAVQALAWGRRDRDGFNPAWFDSGFGPL